MTQGRERGWFGRLAVAVMRHPRMASALIALSCVLALALSSLLVINPNILDLLPEDNPTTQAILRLNQEEGGANLLTIAVQGDDPETLGAFMDTLSDRLSAMEDVDYVLHDIDADLRWRLGVLQLTPDELRTIRDKVRAALALGPGVQNPLIAGRILALGPLTDKLAQADARDLLAAPAADAEGHLLARVLVRPTGSAYNAAFARPFRGRIYDTLDELDPEARGLEIAWVGGAYRHSVEEVEGIIQDLSWTAALSLVLVMVVLGLGFRELRAVLLIFTPLVVGNILTWGFAGVAVGTLNSFTSYFTAILIGLGVDFAIHLYARYREERTRTDDLEEAVARAWDTTGPPCATAALTSAGGFCALWVAGFHGFQHLGTLLAGGVLLCLISVLVMLPLLILWRERQDKAVPLPRVKPPTTADAPVRYRFAPVGLVGVVLVTALAATQLPHIGFEYDLSQLRQQGTSYAQLTETQRTLAEDSFAPVIVSYDDDESLLADHERLSAAVADGQIQSIGRVLSIHSVLPTAASQAERVGLLKEIAVLSQDESARYLPTQVRDNLAALSAREPVVLASTDLPRGLQHILGAADGRHRLMLMPQGNMWDLRQNKLLADEVAAWLPGRSAASEFLALAMLQDLIGTDAPRIAGLALVLIFLWTLLDLRSIGRSVGAVVAMCVGMIWAGAGMAMLDLKLSLVNFAGVPILMGIGVDIVIHLLHRLAEEGPGQIRRALTTTGWAAVLSTLTTVLSFAALHVASNQGVRSLGTLIVMGLTVVTIAAFVVVPLGWMMAWRFRGALAVSDAPPEA